MVQSSQRDVAGRGASGQPEEGQGRDENGHLVEEFSRHEDGNLGPVENGYGDGRRDRHVAHDEDRRRGEAVVRLKSRRPADHPPLTHHYHRPGGGRQ
jgi:hypothetical protein